MSNKPSLVQEINASFIIFFHHQFLGNLYNVGDRENCFHKTVLKIGTSGSNILLEGVQA